MHCCDFLESFLYSITPLSLAPSVRPHTHTHSLCLASCVCLSVPVMITTGIKVLLGLVLNHPTIVLSPAYVHPCVSTACLNYSHQCHYWEHSPPPTPFTIYPSPPSLKTHQEETGGLWGLRTGGPISWTLHHREVVECLSSFTTRGDKLLPVTFLGWIIESLPAGTQRASNVYHSRLSRRSTDDQGSTVLVVSCCWSVFMSSPLKGWMSKYSAVSKAAKSL